MINKNKIILLLCKKSSSEISITMFHVYVPCPRIQIKTSQTRVAETESDDAHHGATLNVFAINKLFLQMMCTETEKKN